MPARIPDERREAHFWSKVDKTGECWEWTGYRAPEGYGRFTVGRRSEGAHRVAYRLTYGPIPAGLHVCHHCDNRPCVRPDHLFLGTIQDNMRDRDRKGRQWSKHGKAKVFMISNVPGSVKERVRRGAKARNWSTSQYIGALLALHDAGRALADAGDERVQAQLTALGLQTVAVSFTA